MADERVTDLQLAHSVLGYTGVPGAYAYEVLQNLLSKYIEKGGSVKGQRIERCQSHRELVQAVHEGRIDYAILPIENSIVGEVRDSTDLIKDKNIHIVGEVRHRISHSLLGIEGASLDTIQEVYSHEQALMQCSQFLATHSSWQLGPMSNTAVSAKYVSDTQDITKACIANASAKQLYGLDVLAPDIANFKENFTRFFIITHKDVLIRDAHKLSIIVQTQNTPGALVKVLRVFEDHQLNMVNIKSRPCIHTPWEYFFYIDIEGEGREAEVQQALIEVRELSNYLQVLGHYKIYDVL